MVHLTITTLTMNTATSGNESKVVIESGGTLTITNNITINSYCQIFNRGTLTFSGAPSVGSGANCDLVTDISTAVTTITPNFTWSSNGRLVNRGTINCAGTPTINGTNTVCCEESVMNFNKVAAWSATISGLPFMAYSGNAANYAVINYGGPNSINVNVFPSTKYRICNNDATGQGDLTGSTGGAYYAAACSFPPLPILLTQFSAQLGSVGVNLTWTTSQELNNDHFDLERSYDGINFEKINQIVGQGTKNSPTTYDFNDSEANTQVVVYYRLRQEDVGGQFNYSNTILLNGNHGDASIEIFPNPIEEGQMMYAKFGDNDEGEATISLTDMSGKLINAYLMNDIHPNGIYAIEDKNLLLAVGNYILQIKTQQHVYCQKLEVK